MLCTVYDFFLFYVLFFVLCVFISLSLCLSEMAGVAGNPLPIEGDSAELRRDKIERLRRAVGSLPRTPGVGLFLAGMTSHVLDLQVRLEDDLRASAQVVADVATTAHQGDARRQQVSAGGCSRQSGEASCAVGTGESACHHRPFRFFRQES